MNTRFVLTAAEVAPAIQRDLSQIVAAVRQDPQLADELQGQYDRKLEYLLMDLPLDEAAADDPDQAFRAYARSLRDPIVQAAGDELRAAVFDELAKFGPDGQAPS